MGRDESVFQQQRSMEGHAGRMEGGEGSQRGTKDVVENGRWAFLPRLRRQEQIEAEQAASGSSAGPSMAERLARMRVEDRRRARNEELRNASSLHAAEARKSFLRAEAPAFQPARPIHSVNGSASSRAGTFYLSAAQLSRQETHHARRVRALRQKFAGPAPPTSWRSASSADAQGLGESLSDHKLPSHASAGGPAKRRDCLASTCQFFPGGARPSSPAGREPTSLTDLSLCVILRQVAMDTQGEHALCHQVVHLPQHLKERALALSGRWAMTDPMTETGLSWLFGKGEMTKVEARKVSEGMQGDEEDDALPDAWDAESSSGQVEWSEHALSYACLDLSFAQVSTRMARSLLRDFGARSGQLRALSLAGWGSSDTRSRGRVERSLRTSASLFNVLDQLVGLQFLSLAGSKLLPGGEEEQGWEQSTLQDNETDESFSLTADAASEAIAFLKKLSRRTTRLTVLDLSGCRWVNGGVIANIGWHSTNAPVRRLAWPQLSHLVLTKCPAFHDERMPTSFGADDGVCESGAFAGPWHAAHHGSLKATQSPYFIAHKPGLGRALLAHGVGSWDALSGRNSLVGREAAALARHGGHVRAAAADTARGGAGSATTRSAFHDDDDELEQGALPPLPSTNPPPFPGYAISHGVAPFALNARQRGRMRDPANVTSDQRRSAHRASPAAAVPPRCPVKGVHVARHEWERARVLDAVRGRWGSAIVGTLVDNEEGDMMDEVGQSRRKGVFTTVYF